MNATTTTLSLDATMIALVSNLTQYCPLNATDMENGWTIFDLDDPCPSLLQPYCIPNQTTSIPKSTTFPSSCYPPYSNQESTSTMTTLSTATNSVAAPGPTQSGISPSCNKYLMANPGGSCTAFASRAGITVTQSYAWNTVLGPSGENCTTQFWGNEYYCVGLLALASSSVPFSSKTSTFRSSSTMFTASAPSPTQSGIAKNCNSYLMANAGGSCTAFASRAGISLLQLYAWNPVLGTSGENCNTQF